MMTEDASEIIVAIGPLPIAGSKLNRSINTVLKIAVALVTISEKKVAKAITKAIKGIFQTKEMIPNMITPVIVAIKNAIAICLTKYVLK